MKKALCFLSMACILLAAKGTTPNSFSISTAIIIRPARTSFMYANVFVHEPGHYMPLLSERLVTRRNGE